MSITTNVFFNNIKDKNITGGSISGLATDLAVADGGTGQSTAAAAFNALKQAATTEATGVLEIATDAEAVAKTATDKALVSSNLPSVMASPGAIGGTTPGTIRALLDEDIEASSGNLTANQCADGMLGNQGQTDDVTKTLPACAAGMSLRWVAGTTIAKYYRFDPDASNYFIVDGVAAAAGKYVGIATVTKGDAITIEAVKTGAAEYNWNVVTGLGPWAAE